MREKLMVFGKEIDFKKTLNILMLIAVIGGIVGFIYETLFYRYDLGHFVKRGSTFGPWIPIYAFGSIAITLLLYRYNKKPFLVFILGTVLTGLIEYITGAVLLYVWNIRLWDYNIEKLNFGNINGFVCLRSVLLFGIAGVFLTNAIVPHLIKITGKANEKAITIISRVLFGLFIMDIICFQIINLIK